MRSDGPLTSTGTCLLGLIKHNAVSDSRCFGEVFDRPFPEAVARWDDESQRGADHWATEHESRDDVVGLYTRVWAHTDEMIEALDLDSLGYVPWWQEEVPLFNVMVHRLSDATRHAGHADTLREGLDGSVGAESGSSPRHGRDDSFWKNRLAIIDNAAQAATKSSGA